MAYQPQLAKAWTNVRCSNSIRNFRDKLTERGCLRPTLFGLYTHFDYLRFVLRRERIVFWCGSDILNLKKRPISRRIIAALPAVHICENEVERDLLRRYNIKAIISPTLFDDPEPYEISFTPSKTPHVYLCTHPGRDAEYGLPTIEAIALQLPEITFHIYGQQNTIPTTLRNIVYHGIVPGEQFDREIRGYHAALRLNEFDGFAETVAKSVLLGQYPITRIYYPQIDYAPSTQELVALLKTLKHRRKPNPARQFWYERLKAEIL